MSTIEEKQNEINSTDQFRPARVKTNIPTHDKNKIDVFSPKRRQSTTKTVISTEAFDKMNSSQKL